MKNRLCLGILMAGLAWAAQPYANGQAYVSDLNALLSRLQSMGHGYYTDQEWNEVMGQLDDLAARAGRNGDPGLVVQARAVKAMVLSDMRKDYASALQVLDETLAAYGARTLPEVKRLFVQKAEVYERMGDGDAVRRTIEEFRSNPNFDPMDYPYQVGQGRNTPLSIMRPTARGSDSVSVTAMEAARERARLAPGNLFPEFSLVDAQGRTVRLADLRGKVVLVDFWLQDWTPWRRELGYLKSTHARYRDAGFEIVGIALDRNVAAAQAFVAEQGLAWTQVYGERALPRQLNIFGESTSFLVDRNGLIVGRDLRGADLAAAVQRALGSR